MKVFPAGCPAWRKEIFVIYLPVCQSGFNCRFVNIQTFCYIDKRWKIQKLICINCTHTYQLREPPSFARYPLTILVFSQSLSWPPSPRTRGLPSSWPTLPSRRPSRPRVCPGLATSSSSTHWPRTFSWPWPKTDVTTLFSQSSPPSAASCSLQRVSLHLQPAPSASPLTQSPWMGPSHPLYYLRLIYYIIIIF